MFPKEVCNSAIFNTQAPIKIIAIGIKLANDPATAGGTELGNLICNFRDINNLYNSGITSAITIATIKLVAPNLANSSITVSFTLTSGVNKKYTHKLITYDFSFC